MKRFEVPFGGHHLDQSAQEEALHRDFGYKWAEEHSVSQSLSHSGPQRPDGNRGTPMTFYSVLRNMPRV